jgi:2-polyprenyl-3-methyl-5-hydroxy-6-metoxy-1,4-benzoquinol methylase
MDYKTMSVVTESEIKKGHAVYTPIMLKLYKLWVLDISNQWIWRCPKAKQLEQFNKYLTANHLDIGVGTGYYLKSCTMPPQAKLSLMDLNPNCLNEAKQALLKKGITATTYQADIFKRQPALAEKFTSISMNYLLHCLPGTMQIKEECINNAVSMLQPEGVLFGATILSNQNLHTTASQFLCSLYNKKGIFSNQQDSQEELMQVLSKHLIDVKMTIIGCVAIFNGTKPIKH